MKKHFLFWLFAIMFGNAFGMDYKKYFDTVSSDLYKKMKAYKGNLLALSCPCESCKKQKKKDFVTLAKYIGGLRSNSEFEKQLTEYEKKWIEITLEEIDTLTHKGTLPPSFECK